MMTLFSDEYIQKAYGRECWEDGRKDGLRQGELKGRNEGRKEGVDSAFLLMQKLFDAGRIDEAKRVVSDKALQNRLMQEFSV